MAYFAITLSAVIAGIIQTVTGFGAAIFMMLIVPYFFDIVAASALVSSITMGLGIALAWKFRRQIQWKICIFPTTVYLVCSVITISLVTGMDLNLLSVIFGGFLVALAIYFFVFSERITLRANRKNATVCAAISGITSGLFGIGGPLMAIYFISAAKDKESYIGSIQFLLGFTNVINLLTRISNGIYTADLLPMTVVGLLGIILGKRFGLRILERLDPNRIKKLVYGFVALSGVLTLIQNL